MNTGEIARRAGATVVREPVRGYGAACLRALTPYQPGTKAVAFMQADGSEDPRGSRPAACLLFTKDEQIW